MTISTQLSHYPIATMGLDRPSKLANQNPNRAFQVGFESLVTALPEKEAPYQADRGRARQAAVRLDAVALQVFLQSMLPQKASSVFGKGTAGDVWKSMLAEKLGETMASSGRMSLTTTPHPLRQPSETVRF